MPGEPVRFQQELPTDRELQRLQDALEEPYVTALVGYSLGTDSFGTLPLFPYILLSRESAFLELRKAEALMMLSAELRERLKGERGICLHELCDRCGRLLDAVRYTRLAQSGAWCSRPCRDGADAHEPGTCKTRKARLPEGKRRGAAYCDDACKQAAHRLRTDVRLSKISKLSVTKTPIYTTFSSEKSSVRRAGRQGSDRALRTAAFAGAET